MIYKIYSPDGKPVFFNYLSEIAKCFDLTDGDIKKVRKSRGYAMTSSGLEILIYTRGAK